MRRLTLAVLPILLIAVACSPAALTPGAPTPAASLPVISATQLPLPTDPATQVPTGNTTSGSVCVCPTGVASILKTSVGIAGQPPVICNCPAIIVEPTADASTPTVPMPDGGNLTIHLDDNGRVVSMRPGDTFLLDLGMDTYDWSVEIDNQAVLSRVPGVLVIRGAQGIYEAHTTGQATLTATGDPLCRQSAPPCAMPSMIFKITVNVR